MWFSPGFRHKTTASVRPQKACIRGALCLLVLSAILQISGAYPPYYYTFKRAGNKLSSCIDSNGMERHLRSGGLNYYLFGLAQCVASVGRPRFGKRSGQQTPPSSQLEYYNDADYNGFDETLKGLMDLKKRLIIAEAKRRLGAGYEGMGRRET